MKIGLTNFAKRHFDKNFSGTFIGEISPEKFIHEINNKVKLNDIIYINDGYADFCKLILLQNFTKCLPGTVKISHYSDYIKTKYIQRSGTDELPVLTRYVEVPKDKLDIAKYLIIVLYSREQLFKEHMSKSPELSFELDEDVDYGIVAILAQDSKTAAPIPPITMMRMRNSLCKLQGGSGVDINKDEYLKSVNFWSKWINVKTI